MLWKSAQRILVGEPVGKNLVEDLDADVTIVLKCILMEWDWRTWWGWMWLRTEKK
jgi:hypothetical protein